MRKKVLLLVLLALILISGIMVYKIMNKPTQTTPPEIDENINEMIPEEDARQEGENEIIVDEELTEETIQNVVETYLSSQEDIIKNYKFNKISLDSNTDELKQELNYEPTDVLAFVEYETQINGQEGWTKESVNCFILRKENGRYFVYKAGTGW